MRRVLRYGVVCAIALSAPAHAQAPVAAGASPSPQALTRDGVVARRGAPGEIHQYTIDVHEDMFAEISVSQQSALVRLTLIDPGDSEVFDVDLPSLEPLPEPLMFIARRAGAHRINVTLARHEDRPRDHEYELHVIALRSATPADRRREACFATTLQGDGLARRGRSMADFSKAIDLLKSAAACWQKVPDDVLELATLSSLAALSGMFSEYRLDAAAAYERLIPMLRAAGRTALELLMLDDLVVEYIDDGRSDRARETAIEMQRLAAKLGDRQKEGRAYQRLGSSEYSLGNYEGARRAALSTIDIAKQLPDASLLAAGQLLLGRIEEVAGDYEAALARYEQGLHAGAGDRFAEPGLRNALGFLRLRRGEHEEAARQFEERLKLAAIFVQRDAEALARVGLGDVRLATGDRESARQMYAAAAETLRRGVPTLRCIAIQRLGRLALSESRLDEAAAHFAEMLAINRQMGNPPCEAEAQAGIADIALARNDLDAADVAARQVIQIAEQFREAVPSLESRALGFGALAPAFDRAVEVSMRRAERGDTNAVGRALLLNERALARGLLDHLSQVGWDSRPASDRLALERRRVREQWRVRVAQYQVAALTERDPGRAERLRQEMTGLELQLRDLEARGDDGDERRARVIRPQVLDLDAVQQLLDPDTTLIEYALGEHQSYLWIVTARELHGFSLPRRAEIESAARAVHRDLMTSSGAVQASAEDRRQALSRLVLAPAASLLKGQRLVIVSAGALSLVPFASLPFEREPGDWTTLISRFEIVHAPSATTLGAMRALTERRSRPKHHTVVFADPIFEPDDPRAPARRTVSANRRQQSGSRSAQQARSPEGAEARSMTALGASFPRLPFSRAEANALTALAPGQVTTFLDGQARRDRALGLALGDYRFIHFATHAIVHPEVPSLSSIVLSFVDGTGTPHDPFLTLPDIYDMRLNAELVVLSACSTAEGRHVPGEGPIGLTRAFMYAGAPRVVASLWRVNDSATAELMKRFYRGMLVEGRTAASALRAAQEQVAAMPRWASPYYWAPFVLQGDWR